MTAPLIVDPSAGGLEKALKGACADFERATNIKVVVKLRAGQSLKSDSKAEPLRMKECGRNECLCCSKGNPGGCEKNSSSYRIVCLGCKNKNIETHYEGETGRNAFARGLEHQNDLKNCKEDSPLWKHCQLQHGGEKQEFSMKALGSFKSCMKRQVNEGVRILASQATYVMNSKSEYHQAPIVRVTVGAGLELEQG